MESKLLENLKTLATTKLNKKLVINGREFKINNNAWVILFTNQQKKLLLSIDYEIPEEFINNLIMFILGREYNNMNEVNVLLKIFKYIGMDEEFDILLNLINTNNIKLTQNDIKYLLYYPGTTQTIVNSFVKNYKNINMDIFNVDEIEKIFNILLVNKEFEIARKIFTSEYFGGDDIKEMFVSKFLSSKINLIFKADYDLETKMDNINTKIRQVNSYKDKINKYYFDNEINILKKNETNKYHLIFVWKMSCDRSVVEKKIYINTKYNWRIDYEDNMHDKKQFYLHNLTQLEKELKINYNYKVLDNLKDIKYENWEGKCIIEWKENKIDQTNDDHFDKTFYFDIDIAKNKMIEDNLFFLFEIKEL